MRTCTSRGSAKPDGRYSTFSFRIVMAADNERRSTIVGGMRTERPNNVLEERLPRLHWSRPHLTVSQRVDGSLRRGQATAEANRYSAGGRLLLGHFASESQGDERGKRHSTG